jgi:hypothetical protein
MVETENEAVRRIEFSGCTEGRGERVAVGAFMAPATEDREERIGRGRVRVDDNRAHEPESESGYAGLRATGHGGGGELGGVGIGHGNEG